jgi:hypothetical protein
LILTGLTNLDGWRLTYPVIQDFYLEMILKSGVCSGADHYGMIVRIPDAQKPDNGYLYGISCDGKYAFRMWNGQNMDNLVDWTASPVIITGSNQVNRIGLMAKNNQFDMYINGVLVASIKDNHFTKGSFGVFVGSRITPKLSVWVDQISYWENP